jgi:hypothetical protein
MCPICTRYVLKYAYELWRKKHVKLLVLRVSDMKRKAMRMNSEDLPVIVNLEDLPVIVNLEDLPV